MRASTVRRARDPHSACRRSLVPAAGVLALGILFLAGLTAAPKDWRGQLALVFSPQASSTEIMAAVAAMEARVVRGGGLGNLVVVSFDRETTYAELRRHGAWLVLDPILAGACTLLFKVPPPDEETQDRKR
ncbi:MAG: hypothetical protein QNJ30_04770 [Kiloniellales bacterium]|nr:hypothetical protein [Kiloniellales bacterium]